MPLNIISCNLTKPNVTWHNSTQFDVLQRNLEICCGHSSSPNPQSQASSDPSPSPQTKIVTCMCMGVLEFVITYRSKNLQILDLQLTWLSQQELPRNSLLGAVLTVNISLSCSRFPKSFLEISNLCQNVIMYVPAPKYLEVHHMWSNASHIPAPKNPKVCLLTMA